MNHHFHIPVMGLAFTLDTPLKVARFGISSVISIMDDELLEDVREHYHQLHHLSYTPIPESAPDSRAARITAYLDMVQLLVDKQMEEIRLQPFTGASEADRYFELLPSASPWREKYLHYSIMPPGDEKAELEALLRKQMTAGSIDVNIMVKLDKQNYAKDGTPLPVIYCDGHAALRGFANSNLQSSVVLSAGYNPRLYQYLETFKDFFPDDSGFLKKKIILKVSDYRSALVQGKLLAKKGLWVSEFRIESGLNCGGHAFATEGVLLGTILETFRKDRQALSEELFGLCTRALADAGKNTFTSAPEMKVTVQGGIGTAGEQRFLLEHYELDATGWGSPFLLVPEATTVDEPTLRQLAVARKEDYYLSDASPLGVPFNNFRSSTSEQQRKERMAKNRPGSPCYKKFLSSNTEYTEQAICTASRQYQHLKIKELETQDLSPEEKETALKAITDKDCLCEGLGASAKLKNGIAVRHKMTAVAICPGPNLAYFSGTFSLKDMTDHIYGRKVITNALQRSDLFINELRLYVDYLKKETEKIGADISSRQQRYIDNFKKNLQSGIDYYKKLAPALVRYTDHKLAQVQQELSGIELQLSGLKPRLLPIAVEMVAE